MSTKTITKIRSAVTKAKKNGGRRVRYPKFVKNQVRELLREGASRSELSRLLGIGEPTLLRWSEGDASIFRRVRASGPAAVESASVSVVLPDGIRIECVSACVLREVLESLK